MADITTGRTDLTIELYVYDMFRFQTGDTLNFPGRTILIEGVSDT